MRSEASGDEEVEWATWVSPSGSQGEATPPEPGMAQV